MREIEVIYYIYTTRTEKLFNRPSKIFDRLPHAIGCILNWKPTQIIKKSISIKILLNTAKKGTRKFTLNWNKKLTTTIKKISL